MAVPASTSQHWPISALRSETVGSIQVVASFGTGLSASCIGYSTASGRIARRSCGGGCPPPPPLLGGGGPPPPIVGAGCGAPGGGRPPLPAGAGGIRPPSSTCRRAAAPP